MVRKVIQAGDPRLKKPNKEIKNLNSSKTKQLIKDLGNTLYKTGLVGIASPQIGENHMIFLTHPRTTKARKIGKEDKLRVFINPKFTFKSKEKNLIYEGCGSMGGHVDNGAIFGPVIRPTEVEIEATDEKGIRFRLRCDGVLARIIQHEMDHLKGVEFIQKVSDYSKIIMELHYKKYIRNSRQQRQNCKITKIEYRKIS